MDNNITKAEALDWLKANRKAFPPNIIFELIHIRCFYGDEIEDICGEDRSFDVSYLCRAYNITEYGKSNRIKNVYKKYRQNYDADQLS